MFNNLGTALEHLDQLDDARMAYEAGGKLGSKEARVEPQAPRGRRLDRGRRVKAGEPVAKRTT